MRHLLGARELLAAHGPGRISILPSQRPSKGSGFTWLYELRPDALTIRVDAEPPVRTRNALPLEVHLPLQDSAPVRR